MTRASISEILELSAGTEMAFAPAALLGSALSAATASSHAFALREVMYTLDAPAWRRLYVSKMLEMYWKIVRGNGRGGFCLFTLMLRVNRGRENRLLLRLLFP